MLILLELPVHQEMERVSQLIPHPVGKRRFHGARTGIDLIDHTFLTLTVLIEVKTRFSTVVLLVIEHQIAFFIIQELLIVLIPRGIVVVHDEIGLIEIATQIGILLAGEIILGGNLSGSLA